MVKCLTKFLILTKSSVVTYKQFIILYEEVGKWAAEGVLVCRWGQKVFNPYFPNLLTPLSYK